MLIEFHRTIVADGLRNEAFHEALKRVIVPGRTTVADVGSGTGLLGFMAARLGAKRVFLYEHGDVMKLAKALARRNHIRRCVFIPEHSTAVIDPEPVDGLSVLYDDADLLVVDKPVGVAAHPSPGWSGPTVVQGLAAMGYHLASSGAAERQGRSAAGAGISGHGLSPGPVVEGCVPFGRCRAP